MNVIQVKFDIDIDNEQQLNSFNTFVQSLKNSGGTATVNSPVKEIKLPASTTPATAATATATATPATPATATPATTTATPEGVSKKLFEIRSEIGKKAGTHRDIMINKLSEYGVTTATDLPVDKYEEFHQFLLALV